MALFKPRVYYHHQLNKRRVKRRKLPVARPPELTVKQILGWADEFHERTGRWPRVMEGRISGSLGETWARVHSALASGSRGLPGGSSLAKLLAERRGVRNSHNLPPLTCEQILGWADEFHRREGAWPTKWSGSIPGNGGETWANVDNALSLGLRSFPGGSSLIRLLAEHRGVRNRLDLPALTIEQILKWMDQFRARTGEWPDHQAGSIAEAPGETWLGVDAALRAGRRGLTPGLSLARLLAAHRGVRNLAMLPPLTCEQILDWADEHFRRTGRYPNLNSGSVAEAPDETWNALDQSLARARRGLPGGSSLAKLLAERRGHRNIQDLPPLTRKQILAWADEFHRRAGRWPEKGRDGLIEGTLNETWSSVDTALRNGMRGLAAGSSLARLLAKHRGVRNRKGLPRLKRKQILAWADAYHRRTGRWPTKDSGPIAEAPGETWSAVHTALQAGLRGLRGGSSLARLLSANRRVRNIQALPPLSVEQILEWADAFHDRAGEWPTLRSGPIAGRPGETWGAIHIALQKGHRGLPGSSSLPQLLAQHRGARNIQALPPLTEKQIRTWVEKFYRRFQRWPTKTAGLIPDSNGETWSGVNAALRVGVRGLPGGSSLAQLIARMRSNR